MSSEDSNEQSFGNDDTARDSRSIFMPPQNVDATLSLRPGDNALDQEPADLPQPHHGERIAAFTRNEGQLHEEYALWKISKTPVNQIMAFYEQAAMAQQFQKLTQPNANPSSTRPVAQNKKQNNKKKQVKTTAVATTQASPTQTTTAPIEVKPVSMIFTRNRLPETAADQTPHAANDVLIIRAKPTTDGKVHVTLWYRHAVTVSPQ